MKFNTKIGALVLAFSFGLMAFLGLAQGALVQAQVTTASASSCLSLQNSFGYGSTDAATGNAISALQTFLNSQGFFSSAYFGTGRYGAITLASVAKFQGSHGIPATGYVGPLTRAAIASLTCGSSTVTPPTTTTASTLYSVNPTSGAVGATVSITGFGFTNSNTVLFDGSVAATNVPIASSRAIACTTDPSCHGGINQTLTFTVPSALAPYCAPGNACPMFMRLTTAGTYTVSVLNSNGTSNTLTFTVTGGPTTAQPLSITGLSTPTSLALGQSGTWTVHVLGSSNANLQYSVVWGDQAVAGQTNSLMMPSPTAGLSSATFTHTYGIAGTYNPVFTVTDGTGASVSTSASILVSPLY